MWNLLKTEFKYNVLIIVVGFAMMLSNIFLLMQIDKWNLDREELDAFFMSFIGIATIVMFAKIWILRSRENRDRIHSILPVTPLIVSFSRILVVFIPWCIALVLMIFAHFIIPNVWNELGEPVIRFALITMLYTSALLLRYDFVSDKKSNVEFSRRYLLSGLVLVAASAPILYFVFDLNVILSDIISFIFCLVLLGWTVVKFSKSKNYLR